MTKVRPTVHLASFGGIVLALWYASASQSNGVAYLLGFVISAMGLVSSIHALVNVRGISASARSGSISSFAKHSFLLPIRVTNQSGQPRFGLEFRWNHYGPGRIARLDPGKDDEVQIPVPALDRGSYVIDCIELRSRYPFGLFDCSRRLKTEFVVDVFPDPSGLRELPPSARISEAIQSGARREGDDFGGHRLYQKGDAPRRIDWRAVARGLPMLVKEFEGATGGLVHFDIETTPGADIEARLSQLALWILEAERLDVDYSLQLGALEIAAGKGTAHQHRALIALARYPAV